MEDVYVLGISNDYTPPSPSFCVEVDNFNLKVDKDIKSITKISTCANGLIEEIFKSLDTNYATVHLSIDIRIDYMCSQNNMNFHIFTLDKLIYVNLGSTFNKKDLNIDTEVLDLGVVNIKDKQVEIYSLVLTCLY